MTGRTSRHTGRSPRCSLVLAAFALLLVGCAVGPDFQVPTVDAPPRTRGQIDPGVASLADLPWWDVFDDPVLQSLIEQALRDNYTLEEAAARVVESRNLVGVARADLFPQLGYGGEASRQRSFVPIAAGNTNFNAFLGAFNVAWEIDLWGRVRRSTEAAEADFAASEAVRRGVLLSLVSDVARSYLDLLALDRELEIAHETVDVFADTYEIFERRYLGGVGTMLEVSRGRAALGSARRDVAEIERLIAIRENGLSVLLARSPGAIPRGRPLIERDVVPRVPLGVPSQLLRRRPDILQAEQELVATNAEIGVAVASFFPRIGLSSLYGGQSTDLASIVKSDGAIWAIAGSVGGPLFQGGRLLGNYRASEARYGGSVARYQRTVLEAFSEVANVLVTQQKLRTIRSELEDTVEALTDAVDLSLQRYNDGVASYFEVLQAQQERFPAAIDLARAHRDQLVVVVDFYRILGGGWDVPTDRWQESETRPKA